MTAQAAAYPVLADSVLPRGAAADALAVAGAAALIAAGAQLQVPLPFTPVPLSGQTLGVLYAGLLLGPRRGAAAAVLYVASGACGLPVFSGGASGAARLLGPTGGYLLGFPVGAWCAGLLAERGWDRTPARAFCATLLASAPILALGLLGLSRFVPAERLLAAGLWPFLPGDVLKAALTAGLLPLGRRLLGR